MQNFRRSLAALACLVVGIASFALSYVALRDVAVALGAVPSYLGWLVPIVIDGGIICGSAVLWSLSKEQGGRPKFPFFFVGSMVLMSVVVNVAHAGDSILAKVIAALPPLILLGTLELVADQGRRTRKNELQDNARTTVTKGVESTEALVVPSVPVEAPVTVPSAPVALNDALQAPEPVVTTLHAVPEPRAELTLSEPVTKVTKTRATPATKTAKTATTRTAAPRTTATKSAAAKAEVKPARTRVAAMKENAPAEVKTPATTRARSTRQLRVTADEPESI